MSEKIIKVGTAVIAVVRDHVVWVSFIQMGIVFTPEHIIDWGIKCLFGMPAAVYMCFKIHNEFLKKKPNDKVKRVTK